jgi:hypothetical protein
MEYSAQIRQCDQDIETLKLQIAEWKPYAYKEKDIEEQGKGLCDNESEAR